MSKVEDMLDEIMTDLGIRDEIARSIRETEDRISYTENESVNISPNTDFMIDRIDSAINDADISYDTIESNRKKTSKEARIYKLIGTTFSILINILFYIMVVVAIVNVSTYGFDFAYDIYAGTGQDENGRNILFEIEEGTSSFDVAKQLEINDIVSNKYSFWIRVKLSQKNIQPNTYTLSTDMAYEEIIDSICR